MNLLSTVIVQKFLHEDFLPNLIETIKVKETTEKIVKRMPKIVTKTIINNVVQSSLKKTYIQTELNTKPSFKEGEENRKIQEHISVPKRHHRSVVTPLEKNPLSSEITEKNSEKSNSRITTQCTSLIKLVETEQEESEEVKRLRKIKKLMKKYQEAKEKNRVTNEQNRKIGVNLKKSLVSQCLYHHTYGYHSQIVEVNPLQLQNIQQTEHQKSLLQILKANLDEQLQKERLNKKILEREAELKKKKAYSIPLCKIETIDQEEGQYKVRDKKEKPEKKDIVDRSLKPLYSFEKSQIQSLSKDIDSSLTQGVKMITFEEKIVEGQYPRKGYSIKGQQIVKDKTKKQKLKTNSSQSVIYSLQNDLKNHSLIDSDVKKQSQIDSIGKHRSVQFSRQIEEKYDALTEFLKRNSDHLTLDTDSRINDIKLPEIKKRKRNAPKRTATEQKMIKGLEGIQVRINAPQNKEHIHFSQRQRHFSALSLKKQTQSSLQEGENLKREGSSVAYSRSKKTLVKDYFQNYKEQFRQKMKGISQGIDLYS